MALLSDIDIVLRIKIQKVCLTEIGIMPNLTSRINVVYNEGINGIITIMGKDYYFLRSKLITNKKQ